MAEILTLEEQGKLLELAAFHRQIYSDPIIAGPFSHYLKFETMAEWNTWLDYFQTNFPIEDRFIIPKAWRNSFGAVFEYGHLFIDKRIIGAGQFIKSSWWATPRWVQLNQEKFNENLKYYEDEFILTDLSEIYSLHKDAYILAAYSEFSKIYSVTTATQKIEMSLLKILQHLKRQNPETYYNDSSNKAHILLWQHYLLIDKSKRQQFRDTCSKFLGYQIQLVTYNHIRIPTTYPKLMPIVALKKFNTQFGVAWIPSKLWDEAKNEDNIRWCPTNKEWFWRGCFTYLYTFKEGMRSRDWLAFNQEFPLSKHKHIDKCQFEGYLYHKKDLQFIPELEVHWCIHCAKDFRPENPKLGLFPITDYHSHGSNWTFLIQRLKNKYDQKTLPMGIEIEMNAKNVEPARRNRDSSGAEERAQSAARHIYESQLILNPQAHNFYFEWDGSLNAGGFEMITNPMSMKYHQNFWPDLMPKIREVALGWDVTGKGIAQADYYGIHITSHRKYWSDLWIARLGYFIGYKGNRDFIHAISQRAIIYGAGDEELARKNKVKILDDFIMENKKLAGSNRSNIYLKENNLVEIRIFRSTLNTESFLKNIEFVDSFRKWCQETGFSYKYQDYLTWLLGKKEHQKLYPSLLSYLSRDKFACKRRPLFKNPFKEFLKEDFTKGQKDFFHFQPPADANLAMLGYEDEADVLLDKDA